MNNFSGHIDQAGHSVEHCKTTFNVSGHEVVNNYQCNQRGFTSANMWRIQKQRKHFTVSSGMNL